VGTRGYILKKVFQAFLTLLAVIVFNFFLFRILPADPVDILTRGAGAKLDEAEKAELRASYGLDKPLFPGQFLDFMGDTLRGDLGQSIIQRPGEDVTAIFGEFMWPTLLLVGVSTIVSTVLGIFMGIYAGWRRNGKFDLFSMGFSLVLYSMPEFWLGMLLILLFSTTLGWFPSSGRATVGGAYTGMAAVADVVNHLFLPALTLTLAYLGEYYLVMRSSLLDVLGEDYITTARAKGVREKWVLRRHAVRNALLPTITLIALSFGFVLGGAITVEVVFGYKGLGGLTYAALQNRDFPLLQGIFLISSATVIGMNLVADLIYGYFDPRVREA
jgi:peptide/nickel transport system permease protein